MEHKLILGGEQYLGFARSRIKALRAAGRDYAGHRYIMPGGEVVTVRIVGEHEYITLEGGGQLVMDSGVVDMKGVSAAAAVTYSNGTRIDTTSTAAYTEQWTQPEPPTGRWGAWRSFPDGVPHGQLIGTVFSPPLAGHIRADATRAESFEAQRNPVEGGGWEWEPQDGALAAKKHMVSTCPASMFTGRCRLFVQALYGRQLHAYSGDTASGERTPSLSEPRLASDNPPQLSLSAYTRQGDTEEYPDVLINTSTGVYFDAQTGRHWLMNITGAHLNVYPLLSSPMGESLRRYLAGENVGGGNGASPLSEGDIEKLEAYVLAYSRPDVKNMMSVEAGAATPGFSMGYGWHWNWAGTRADIVTSSTVSQGQSHAFPFGSDAMVSTHRRLTVSIGSDGSWSASRSVIEGPTQWTVNRLYWCIAEPEWSSMSTVKTTPRYSAVAACEAPVYAFYNRDELKVLRVKVEIIPATTGSRTMSTLFGDPAVGGGVHYLTAGMLDGFLTEEDPTPAHYRGTFSCGSHTMADLLLGKSTQSERYTLTKDSYTEGVVMPVDSTSSSLEIDHGYFPPFGTPDHTSMSVNYPSIIGTSVNQPPTITATRRAWNRLDTESSIATIVVPFHDAEAVYMQSAKFIDQVDSGQIVTTHASTGLASSLGVYIWVPGVDLVPGFWNYTGDYVTYIAGGLGGLLTTDNPPDAVTSSAPEQQYLVCRAGAVPTTMGELASFHDNEDYAQVTYSVLSGAAGDTPVVISAGGSVAPTGIQGDVPNFPAIVGWV